MSVNCESALEHVGLGVSASLRAVDCVAGEMSADAFGRLFGAEGGLLPALTILLTLYVAIFAIQLLTGRASVGVRALTPRMLTLGLALTFATSWFAYQSVVWNLAVAAPDYLATMMSDGDGSATSVFGDKIDLVFLALQEAAGPAGAEGNEVSAFSPEGMLWMGAMLLLLGTVGVLVTARIALAVLVALGPIFVVLAIFDGTRGMFVGWLKGLVMLALTPLFAVVGGSVMLELAVPVLGSLTATPGQIELNPAAAFFLIGAVHCALMVMVIKVAGTMVAGWTVFGFARSKDSDGGTASSGYSRPLTPASAPAAAAASASPALATSQAIAASRRIDVSAVPVNQPANDSGPGGSGTTSRETRVITQSSGGGQTAALSSGPSRASGIGSRFRAAPARSTENLR